MKSSQSLHTTYEQLMGKPLTSEQVAEMKFNLTEYIEMLAEIDKQLKEKLDKNINRGSDKPPKAIK